MIVKYLSCFIVLFFLLLLFIIDEFVQDGEILHFLENPNHIIPIGHWRLGPIPHGNLSVYLGNSFIQKIKCLPLSKTCRGSKKKTSVTSKFSQLVNFGLTKILLLEGQININHYETLIKSIIQNNLTSPDIADLLKDGSKFLD